jgi:mannose-6-phosphate isomerase
MVGRAMACHRLRNPVQRYAWGSRTALQELLGAPTPGGEAWAELWVGAHPRAPSEVLVGGAWRSLRAWVEENPRRVLGEAVAARFGAQLPFLMKVLAVERPLSLQVHPDAERAARGFAREEAARLALDAPERCYADPNPKPELVCALGPFEALCGLRPIAQALERAERLGAARLAAELDALPHAAPPRDALARLLRLPPSERRALVSELAARAAERAGDDPELAWVARLHDAYPGDAGCAAPLLLHHIGLGRGEALALRPGDLHAYLRGIAVEIMASSDNVLRAGLTSKHVAVEELLAAARPSASEAAPVAPARSAQGEDVYDAGTEWFRLSLLRPARAAPLRLAVERGAEALLCIEGAGELEAADASEPVAVRRGEALFVSGDTPGYALRGEGTFARASAGL